MNTTKAAEHTPGPVESLSERIIQLWFAGKNYTDLKNLADAAHDLLAALKKLVQVQDSIAMDYTEADWIAARQAIAKAQERSNERTRT